MDHATLIVLLALLQYVLFTARVGLARGKYHVDAPSCEGDENWNRLFRVQQNTLEQLIVFVPATYAFAIYMS
ncbi:MAG: MAPEG family protein, partial [Lysobacterales bacterium]